MALADFWEVKDNQVLAGLNILNVYHAKRVLAGADATEVGNAFFNSVLTLNLTALQDDNLTRSVIEVRNLGTPTDFATIDSSSRPGTDAGDHPAIFNAATIQFNRTRTDMKNGQKRFLFGSETDQSNGVWDAAFLTDLATVGASIIAAWKTAAAPAVDVCSFVILKRFCVVSGQSPCLKYRLPDTSAEIDANHYVPLTMTTRSRIRSQVSRKKLI